MMKLIALQCVMVLSVLFVYDARAQHENPFEKTSRIPEALSPLNLSQVMPTGWLKTQLEENLMGFTGHLDSLVPELIIQDDIYGTDRLTRQVKSKDLGAVSEAGDWQVQFLWWNCETQSNWWDGYIRSAILTNDTAHLKRIKAHIQSILATQDADGYLGIYDKDLRYKFDTENGELWAKATQLRGLLAWYTYTGDSVVWHAVKRAVDNVMVNYPPGQSHPFHVNKPDAGGLTHGLVFTDVLESMYRLTGNQAYLDYCLFLYSDFSQQALNEDGQYDKLVNPDVPLKGHGVHTYEQLRPLAASYYASGNAQLKTAMDSFLQKIESTTNPSGGPAGDEFIGGRNADATDTGYEYCSVHELMDSYISLLIKTGDVSYGDKVERLFFNAAQGARHPSASAICYLKTDNAYCLTGGKNGDTSDKNQTRYRYSPVHKEAAVCCVPNAGRIGPYYIQHMWMQEDSALVAELLGPCEVNAMWRGNNILIKEITEYPYEHKIRFEVSTEQRMKFPLKIRKPAWAVDVKSSLPFTLKEGYIVIDRTWNKTTKLAIEFITEPVLRQAGKEEIYFTYGPLVLAHPIEAVETITRQYGVNTCKEMQYTPVSKTIYQYITKPEQNIKKSRDKPMTFFTSMFNPDSRIEESIELVPMGQTILRQVTFQHHIKE